MSFRNLSLIVLFMFIGMQTSAQTPGTAKAKLPQAPGMAILAAAGMPSNDEIDESLMLLQVALDLTPRQVKDIRQLANDRRDRMKSISDQADQKFHEFSTLLNQPNSDPAAIGRAALELKQIREQVATRQAEIEKQLVSILNPTQRQTVYDLGRATEVFVSLRQIGLLQPDLEHGIFMNGLKAPVSGTAPSEY